MSKKSGQGTSAPRPVTSPKAGVVRTTQSSPRWLIAGTAVLAIAALIVVAAVVLNGLPKPAASPASSPAATSNGTVAQVTAGSWTDVTADKLATMLQQHDFTLLNVKTPYSGEISGTDLYIPYDQLATRVAQLPADRAAKIVVYCRSGNESGIAVQTLVGLGYTNLYNLDGGMNAWVASGRQLVTVDRSGG